MTQQPKDRIDLDVGGRIFSTTCSTLLLRKDSMLAALARFPTTHDTPHSTPIFIDRDPDVFAIILSYLRTNRLHLPTPHPPLSAIRAEAGFFNLPELAALVDQIEPRLRVLMLEAKWSVGGRKWGNGCSITRIPYSASALSLHPSAPSVAVSGMHRGTGTSSGGGGMFDALFDIDGEALSWVLHTVEEMSVEETRKSGCVWCLRSVEGRVEVPTRVVIVVERRVAGEEGLDGEEE